MFALILKACHYINMREFLKVRFIKITVLHSSGSTALSSGAGYFGTLGPLSLSTLPSVGMFDTFSLAVIYTENSDSSKISEKMQKKRKDKII